MSLITTAVPKNLEFWALGREGVAGTIVAPTMTIPLNGGAPDDMANLLVDKGIRGDMGEDYNEVLGTLIGQFSMAGNVYLDSIGHVLFNLFGDYTTTTPSATTSVTGSSGGYAAGSVSITGSGMPIVPAGSYLVITGPAGASEVVVTGAIGTASAIPLANALRFTHTAPTISYVTTPATAQFVHKFALLNGTGSNGVGTTGLPANAQPPTHTITHFNGLPASTVTGASNPGYTGYRQYAYWCVSALDVTADTNNLFQHSTKGVSFIGQDNTNATGIVNSQSDASANPAWRFQVALGSAIGGAGNLNNVEQAAVSFARGLAPKYALNNTQNPVTITRLAAAAQGSLQLIAQDESPLLAMLAGTQQQLQIGISPAYTPVGQTVAEGIVFNFQRAQLEAATLTDPDLMTYQVPFRALMNSTDVGLSGARGMVTVTLTNGVPTY